MQNETPIHADPARAYRGRLARKRDETSFQVVVEQTDLWVTARMDLAAEVMAHVEKIRGQLKTYILLDPAFAESLRPVSVSESAPPIARAMAEAAALAGVGPMAAVAGAMAQSVADAFCGASPDILVENGGDAYLRSTKDRVVGLLARPVDGARLGLALPARRFPLAVCASSGRIGHSLSFGSADLVTVLARSGALADAAATALANMVTCKDDLAPMLEAAKRLRRHGLQGVFAQWGDAMAAWGDLELTALE